MVLNLVKLCVGIASVEQLQASLDRRMQQRRMSGKELIATHVTRMVPTRRDELLDGGSLYWVIKGNIQVRLPLLDIDIFTDPEGIRRCTLIMQPKLIMTRWQPRRAFQGWRYLEQKDAPADWPHGHSGDLPPQLQQQLASLGLL